MNQRKKEFYILSKENVHVQTGTDNVAFHHALETDWGGGAAILFSADPTALLPTYSAAAEAHCFGYRTSTENLCFLPIKILGPTIFLDHYLFWTPIFFRPPFFWDQHLFRTSIFF